MSATLFIEGGGDTPELQARCREGFRRLFEKCGFAGRMPQTVACGGRNATFDTFRTAHGDASEGDYVALLVDSEAPVDDVHQAWRHLRHHDGWTKPRGADDQQALLMVTCMETWIVTDRSALQDHYGADLQVSALPSLDKMESRDRASIQKALAKATRNCSNSYRKGKRSFEVLQRLDPAILEQQLPNFSRIKQILQSRLG